MKRIVCLCLFLFWGIIVAAQAATVSGIETVGQGQFGVGLEQEFIFDKSGDNWTESFISGDESEIWRGNFEVHRMYRTMLKVSYGLMGNIDLYAKLGVAKPDYEGQLTGDWRSGPAGGTLAGNVSWKGKSDLAYGVGMNAVHFLQGGWLVGADLQFLTHKNDYRASYAGHYFWGAQSFQDDFEWKGNIDYYEWHIATYAAMPIQNFLPYLGLRYSDARAKDSRDYGYSATVRAKDNFGVFAGAEYMIDQYWNLGLQGRIIDETALSVGVNFRF